MSFIKHNTFLSCSLVSFMLIVLVSVPLHGFNIDTKNVRIIQGTKGTLFGFSVQFLPLDKTTNKTRMLIAAPIASTGPNSDGDGPNTGALKVCYDVRDTEDHCTETMYWDDNMPMVNGTFNERFGSSLTVTESGIFMVCSPRWKDTNVAITSHFTFMPGRCTILSIDSGVAQKELKPFFHTGRDQELYVPPQLKDYFHGLAAYGFSADSDQKSVFVTGAPGVLQFEGSVLIRDESTNDVSMTESVLESKLDTTAYGYLGYSVKVGKFCDAPTICLAAGAPNRNRVGMVVMYKWDNRKSLSITQFIPGSQAWSFFGSSLGAADVDKDGYDELIVGAPYHTDERDALEGHDQGRVFVYSRTAAIQTLEYKVTLDGTRKKFARFGTAVQNIGDINLDGYPDVAVGAPGEDDGVGAIYVYLGGPAGLSSLPSQRITASQVTSNGTPTKGLGFAFSNYAVEHNQAYPMFAATSVVSDTVVLLKCRPIVDVTATLVADPNPVNAEQLCTDVQRPCFSITLCMAFSLRGESKRPLNFQIGLDIDVQVRTSTLKRALFRQDDGQLVEMIPMSKQRIQANGRCMNFRAVLRESQVNQDRFTPVEIVARYTLDEEKPPGIDPVLDAVKPNNISRTVTFVNKCGDDNKCEVDLSIAAVLDYRQTGSWSNVVVNDTKELMVKIDIKNSGETSYWTVIRVDVDSSIPFSRFKSDLPVSCQPLESLAADPSDAGASPAAAPASLDKSTVMCNYYKPLDKDASMSLLVAFDTEHMPVTKNKLTIRAEAQPKDKVNNPELVNKNNNVTVTSSVQIIADVSIESSSSPSEVTVYEAKRISLVGQESVEYRTSDKEVKPMNLTHKILVRNNGPSFLPSTTVNISVPMYVRDGSKLVHHADVKIATADGRVTQCKPSGKFDFLEGVTTTSSTTTLSTSGVSSSMSAGTSKQPSGPTAGMTSSTPTTTIGFEPIVPVNRRRRASDDNTGKVLDTIYSPACEPDSKFCEVFVCVIGTTIPSGSHAEINVSLVIERTNIPIPQDFNTFYFLTRTQVFEPQHPLFKSWKTPEVLQTVTKFHFVQSGGKINIWIIIGSVIAGLVLITIIVIVLWRLGFFKRDKHHQVAQWKRESQRRSRRGYSKAPQADNDKAAESNDDL